MGRNYSFRSGKVIANKFRITPRQEDPASAVQGDMYIRKADGALRVYSGSAWETVSSS